MSINKAALSYGTAIQLNLKQLKFVEVVFVFQGENNFSIDRSVVGPVLLTTLQH